VMLDMPPTSSDRAMRTRRAGLLMFVKCVASFESHFLLAIFATPLHALHFLFLFHIYIFLQQFLFLNTVLLLLIIREPFLFSFFFLLFLFTPQFSETFFMRLKLRIRHNLHFPILPYPVLIILITLFLIIPIHQSYVDLRKQQNGGGGGS